MQLQRVNVGGVTMASVDEGVGTPLLLVHGFPLDHTMWSHQIEHLAGEVRVIAPDLRGYGESELGPIEDGGSDDGGNDDGGGIDPVAGVSMDRYADDLDALLDRLGVTEPIVFCGFSMGGYVLWRFLERHAHRVRAIVLCDTRAAADDDAARKTRLKMADHINEWGAEKVAAMMAPKLFAPRTVAERPDIVAETVRVITAANPAAIAAAQRGMAARPDSTGLLPQIIAPTQVIVGEEDAISTRSEMEFIAGQIAGACFQSIPDAGHMAPVEQPEAVTETLRRFVRQL
ncbi:MAG: alpha/beta hydrolase [Planctomycetota bacterium]